MSQERRKIRPGRSRGRGIVEKIIELLTYNVVTTWGEMSELSGDSSINRQILSYLSRCKLIYKSKSGYIISIPWLLYFYKHDKSSWEKEIGKLAQILRIDEVREIKKIVEAFINTPLERFVDHFMAAPMKMTTELLEIFSKLIPEKCDINECIHLVKYFKWLFTVVMGILDLYSSGVGFNKVVEWLSYLSKQNIKLLELLESEPKGDTNTNYYYYYYMKLIAETSGTLRRISLDLSELKSKRDVLKEVVEWFEKMNEKGEDKIRYYVNHFLNGLINAVTSDISMRILLT